MRKFTEDELVEDTKKVVSSVKNTLQKINQQLKELYPNDPISGIEAEKTIQFLEVFEDCMLKTISLADVDSEKTYSLVLLYINTIFMNILSSIFGGPDVVSKLAEETTLFLKEELGKKFQLDENTKNTLH